MWSLLPLPHMVTMLLVLQIPVGKSFIHAVYSHNSSNRDFRALPARFGSPLPAEGLAGRLFEARPDDTCHSIKGPPIAFSVFIALIHRYNCSFATKLLHGQRVGYQAATVHCMNSKSLLSMVHKAYAKQKIRTPSVFVTDGATGILKWLHRSGKLASVVLCPGHLRFGSSGASQAVRATTYACKCHIRLPGPCLHVANLHIFWMVPMSAVIVSLLIEKYLSMCKKWKTAKNQSYQEQGNEQAGCSLLGSKYQECAICLEKYRDYDSLKVLSCSHAFHSRCIDRWHITQARSKTCPLCMQKVMLVVRLQTVRLWKEEARGHSKTRKLWPGKAKPSFDQRGIWLAHPAIPSQL